MEYEIIPSSNINKHKWDACINTHTHPLVYASYDYLSCLCNNWYGIIFKNYEAVIPVTIKKKYKLPYLYHVPFVQQLGLFGTGSEREITKIISKVYRYGDYAFHNRPGKTKQKITEHNNYLLPLNRAYEEITENYAPGLKQSIKKAQKKNLLYKEENADVAVNLYEKHNSHRIKHVQPEDFKRFLQYCNSTGNYITRGAYDEDGNLLTVALLLVYNNRLYNIMNSTTIKGRSTEANHFLYDCIIHEFAGKYEVLDLEGSDLPGVQMFYKKFGAVNEPYYRLHINRLPFPLNMLKR